MQVHLLTVVSTTLSCCSKEKQSEKLIKQKEMEYVVAKGADSFNLATKPVKLVK